MYNSLISFFTNESSNYTSTTNTNTHSKSEMKAYKIQDVNREARIGITAKNLSEILQKGKQKLKISANVDVTIVLEADGTVVDSDDYLKQLVPQTVLVFLKPGESLVEAGDQVYNSLKKLFDKTKQSEIAKQIRELMTDERSQDTVNAMSLLLNQLKINFDLEERHEHEDWFEGVNRKFNTKSEVMRNSAQQRIRSYYTSAKDELEKESDPRVKDCLKVVMNKLKNKLKKNNYHGHYFDRKSSNNKMCDENGWFTCEGPFDEALCSHLHKINPYASKDSRHVFGLWNLDHIVEKTREVLPKLVQAVQQKPAAEDINSDVLYKYLFTRDNLRLVFIGCHKKAAREQTINFEEFYINSPKSP